MPLSLTPPPRILNILPQKSRLTLRPRRDLKYLSLQFFYEATNNRSKTISEKEDL